MMVSLKILQLLLACFFPLLARSTKLFGNSTLSSSITGANVTKTSAIYSIDSLNDACEASRDAFRNSEYEFYQSASAAGLFSTSTLGISTQTVTFTDYSLVIYTSRDGQDEHPYISTKIPSIQISSWLVTLTTVLTPTYPGSSPTCKIDYDCGSSCTIRALEVQLIYWPANTISGSPNLTVPPNATELVTAIINGTTFTSPSVYLSYDGVSAVDFCQNPIARSYSSAVLSLNPNDVSSIHGIHGGTNRFDFADLNKPYPLRVLFSMCLPTPIESCILDPTEEYTPRLVVPVEIRALDPAWKTCVPDLFGSYDPPRILVPAQALVSSTAAVNTGATSSTAMPVPIHTAPGAVSTSKPFTKDPPAKDPPDKNSPVQNPPAQDPPAQDPPAKDPPKKSPAKDPPTEDPPAKDPPDKSPPAQDPPAQDTPAEDPPAQDPPAQDPPAKDPPKDSPAKDPPTEDPPNDSPAKDPPAKDPPDQDPAAEDPPTKNPPANDQPVKDPPIKSSSTIEPSVNNPSTKDSSTKNPFTNNPPAKDPPTKTPFVKDPPAKDPPAKNPPEAGSPVKTSVTDNLSVISRSYTPTTNSVDQPVSKTQTLQTDETNVSNAPFSTGLPYPPPNDRSAFLGISVSPLFSALAPLAGSDTKLVYPTFTLPHLTIASQIYTANPASQYIIASQTLTPNGQIIVAGTPISLHPSASALVIGSTTKTLPPTFALPPLTIGAQTFTADSESAYIVHGQTLTKGGQITVAGTPVSLAAETPNPPAQGATHPSRPTATPTPRTLGAEHYTVELAFNSITTDQPFTPGGAVPVHGAPIPPASGSSLVVIGPSPTSSEPASSALGLARLIMEGFGGGGGGGDDSRSEYNAGNGTTRRDNAVATSASARARASAPEGSGTFPPGSSANFTGTSFVAAAGSRKHPLRLGLAAVLGVLGLCR